MRRREIAAERRRARELLAIGDPGSSWTEGTAVPAPGDIGALDGFRLVSADGSVDIHVYVYESWGAGTAPGVALVEMVDGEEYRAVTTVNGRLMFFGLTAAGSPDGSRQLDQAMGALAGWE